jgi:hypothetical protein
LLPYSALVLLFLPVWLQLWVCVVANEAIQSCILDRFERMQQERDSLRQNH